MVGGEAAPEWAGVEAERRGQLSGEVERRLWLAGARAEACLGFYRRHGEGGVDGAGREAGQRPRRSAGHDCRRAAVVTRRARRSRAQRRCKRGGSRRGHSDGAGRGQEAVQQWQAVVMPCSALRSGSREAEQRREKGGRERVERERDLTLSFLKKIHMNSKISKNKSFQNLKSYNFRFRHKLI